MVGMVVTCNNTGEGEDEEEVIKNPPTHFSTGSFHLDSLEYEIYIIKSEELSAVTSFISIFIELSDVIYQLVAHYKILVRLLHFSVNFNFLLMNQKLLNGIGNK